MRFCSSAFSSSMSSPFLPITTPGRELKIVIRALQAGLIGPETVVVTTVHEAQVLPAGEIPTTDHDIRLDLIVTPERIIEVPRRTRRAAAGVRWDELTEEKIEAIPLLARLRPDRGRR